MKNEYGAKLDRNGYAPSIIPGHHEYRCLLCGKNGAADPLDRHEIFGMHRNPEIDLQLKQEAKRMAMERYGWTVDDFRAVFRNNYLDEDGTT